MASDDRGRHGNVLPDYSRWLTAARLAVEERNWNDPLTRTWPEFAMAIGTMLKQHKIATIIEFGCGTGHVAKALPHDINYLGLDANQGCIELARIRNPNRVFSLSDIREPSQRVLRDLSCAFSFLKHFGLDEWDDIVSKMLAGGRHSLFSIPIGPEDVDDGTEFPHVRITQQRLERVVRGAGHEVLALRPLPWGETMVTTGRINPWLL